MPHLRTEVPDDFFAPDREDCLRAISLALLKLRALPGSSREKLGREIGCSKDVVSAASNEENMLSFDSIVLLCRKFPEEAEPIRQLICGAVTAKPTAEERIERLRRELDALAREVTA